MLTKPPTIIYVNLTRILSFSSPFTLIQSVQNDRKEEYSSEFKILKWHSTVWNWTQWSITEIKWSNAFELETHTTPNEMLIKPGSRLVGFMAQGPELTTKAHIVTWYNQYLDKSWNHMILDGCVHDKLFSQCIWTFKNISWYTLCTCMMHKLCIYYNNIKPVLCVQSVLKTFAYFLSAIRDEIKKSKL